MARTRSDDDEPRTRKDLPATKRELARESTGDEVGGEEYGRGAPTVHPEQFEEFTDTEPASEEEDGEDQPDR